MNSFKTLSPRQKSILSKVFSELENVLSAPDAKRVLESRNNNSKITLANPDLQPIAFSLRHGTWLTYALGSVKGMVAWIVFFFASLLTAVFVSQANANALFKRNLFVLKNRRWVAGRLRYNAYKKLRVDSRPPILYLRSFSSDGSEDLEMGGSRSLDEQLVEYYERSGPLIAIAGPDDDGVQPGAVRLCFEDDVWRAGVTYLMSVSRIVIIQAGVTHGTLWELGVARRTVEPGKLVISLGSEFFGLPDIRTYEWFREYAEEILGRRLPENLASRYIGFGKDWEPLVFDPNSGWQTAEIQSRPGQASANESGKAAHTYLKCIHCGLINWVDATSCERCGRSLEEYDSFASSVDSL